MLRLFMAIITACLCLSALGLPARAELIVLSATDFVKRCIVECQNAGPDRNVVDRGMLVPEDGGHFFGTVSFPVNNQFVCAFSLVYHDVNANDFVSATLVRKVFQVGGNAFNEPIQMARVVSASGVPDTARRVTTKSIKQPKIQKGNSFYYVDLFFETINLHVLGVQIDVRPTCPAP